MERRKGWYRSWERRKEPRDIPPWQWGEGTTESQVVDVAPALLASPTQCRRTTKKLEDEREGGYVVAEGYLRAPGVLLGRFFGSCESLSQNKTKKDRHAVASLKRKKRAARFRRGLTLGAEGEDKGSACIMVSTLGYPGSTVVAGGDSTETHKRAQQKLVARGLCAVGGTGRAGVCRVYCRP